MTGPPDPLEILVVGWFPAADDLTAGRFVADQVDALRASGRVRPNVVSFENVPVRGSGFLRTRQEAAVAASTGAAIERSTPFNPAGAGGPPGIPVARLAVAAGETPGTGVDHRAAHRTAAILPLVERSDLPAWRLVHAHVGYPEGAAAASAARRLGLPLVITEHATFVESFLADPVVRARYISTVLGAARVIAVSRMLEAELLAAIPGLEGRLTVIPNAIAIDDFHPVASAARAPAELLWVGYRKEIKGIATLLRAFRLVLDEHPEVTLRLIGRSSTEADEAGWHRLAGELGVAGAVQFEPPADRAGVAAAMSRATCFVHPSTRETFGVVAVEALASGLPVVATDSGGVAEVLGDDPESLGALVPASDPSALATAVLRTLDRRDTFDPHLLRAYAERRFGASAVARQIVALYDEVLEEPARISAGPGGRQARTVDRSVAAKHPEPVRSGRVLLVGFVRTELDRALDRFPAGCLADVEIATTGAALTGRTGVTLAPPGTDERVAELIDWGAPPAGVARRLGRRLRRRIRPLAARVGGPERSADTVLTELTRTLEIALGPHAGIGPPLLVCLSGIDHLAAAPLFAAGRAVPSPGGLRWLADLRATGRSDQEVAASASRSS